LELVFTTKSALKRHRGVPLAIEREEFLTHLLGQGTSRASVRGVAILLLHVIRAMKLKKLRNVHIAEIRKAANLWARDRGCHRRIPAGKNSTGLFTYAAKKWFRFHGNLKLPTVRPHPYALQLGDFADYMNSVGLAAATVKSHTWKSAKFLEWFHRRRKPLRQVSLNDVDKFLAVKAVNGWNPTTVAVAGQALRSFFRYAESKNWCRRGMASGIKGPAIPKYNTQPQGPTWKQVQLLLQECHSNRRADIRARPMLMLFAMYGLRSSEVSGLLLKDFNWQQRKFIVRRAKRGGFQQFPIQRDVGDAILEYIAKVRPRSSCKHLFVTLNPPYKPMSPSSTYIVTSLRMQRVGTVTPRRGPHSLRHSCATRLLEKGTPLPEIGEFLGHRTSVSVGIYAKFGIETLKQVADFDLGGLR
jgi:integrase/recombinase XerD